MGYAIYHRFAFAVIFCPRSSYLLDFFPLVCFSFLQPTFVWVDSFYFGYFSRHSTCLHVYIKLFFLYLFYYCVFSYVIDFASDLIICSCCYMGLNLQNASIPTAFFILRGPFSNQKVCALQSLLFWVICVFCSSFMLPSKVWYSVLDQMYKVCLFTVRSRSLCE